MASYGGLDPTILAAQAKYDDVMAEYHRRNAESDAAREQRSAQWSERMAEQQAAIDAAERQRQQERRAEDAGEARPNAWSPAPRHDSASFHFGPENDDQDDVVEPVPPRPQRRARHARPDPEDEFDEDFSERSWLN